MKKKRSYSLTPDALEKLEVLSKSMGISRTSVLEVAIRELFGKNNGGSYQVVFDRVQPRGGRKA